MKFSVTIPTYKSRYLREAIESVVCQTYGDWELIIVDDCSPENIRGIAEPFLTDSRIHYYRNEQNYGAKRLVENWNHCLNFCKGELIICMGDDDRLLPCCLDELSNLADKHPDLNVYHSQTEIIDEKGLVSEQLEQRPEYEDALAMIRRKWQGQKQFVGDFCYRREHLISCGGFYSLPFAWGSDDITAFRAALEKGIANTQINCFQYRENRHSISSSFNDKEKIEAVCMQQKWYMETFNSIRQQGRYSEADIKTAEDAMNSFIKRLTSYHILRDMQRSGLKGFAHWCMYTERSSLSVPTLTKLYFKTLFEK